MRGGAPGLNNSARIGSDIGFRDLLEYSVFTGGTAVELDLTQLHGRPNRGDRLTMDAHRNKETVKP